MPILRVQGAPQQVWRRRSAEWSVLIAVILLLIGLFAREITDVQGQAEGAAVKATLGALRVAFVVEQVHVSSRVGNSPNAKVRRRNPFNLLQVPPANYVGETSGDNAGSGPPGSWSFNANCDCIAYVPMTDQWFSSASGDPVAYFQIRETGNGPLQLVGREAYFWRGSVLD